MRLNEDPSRSAARWLALALLPAAVAASIGHVRTLAFPFWMDAFAHFRLHIDMDHVLAIGITYGESRYIRPVWLAVLVIQKAAFGAAPFGYHAVSVILHFVTAVMLYAVARRIGGHAKLAALTTIAWLAFGWNAYTVAWAGPMVPELIAAPAAMLTVIAFWDGLEGRRYAPLLAIVAFAVAILTKETTLPFALLLTWLAWRAAGLPFRAAVARTAPFWALVLGYVVLRVTVFGGEAVPVRLSGVPVEWLPLTPAHVMTAAVIFAGNVARQLAFIAVPLPMLPLDALGAGFIAAAAIVFGGLAWQLRRAPWPVPARRLATAGVVWCLVLAVPCMFGSHPRLLYQVGMGFAMLLAAAVAVAADSGHRARITAMSVAAIYLMLHAGIGWRVEGQYAGHARSTLSIYADDYVRTAGTAPRDDFDRGLRAHVRTHLAKHGCLAGSEVRTECRGGASYDLNDLLPGYRLGAVARRWLRGDDTLPAK